jgi:hypothetical protein
MDYGLVCCYRGVRDAVEVEVLCWKLEDDTEVILAFIKDALIVDMEGNVLHSGNKVSSHKHHVRYS